MQARAVENAKKDAEYADEGLKILGTVVSLPIMAIAAGCAQSWAEQKKLKEQEKLYFADELVLTMPKECEADPLLKEKQFLINKLEEIKNRCHNIELIADHKTRDKKFYWIDTILFYLSVILFYCGLTILGIFVPEINDFYPMRLLPAIIACFYLYGKIKFSHKAFIKDDAKHLIQTGEYHFIKNEINNISNSIADFSDVSLIQKTKEKLHYFKCCLLNDKNAQITQSTRFIAHNPLKSRALEITICLSWFIPANWIFSWGIVLIIPAVFCLYKAIKFLNPTPTFPDKIDCSQYIDNSDTELQKNNATTRCPHCQGMFEVEIDWNGMEAECPTCNNKFIIKIQ